MKIFERSFDSISPLENPEREEARQEYRRLKETLQSAVADVADLENEATELGINIRDAYNAAVVSNFAKISLYNYYTGERSKYLLLIDQLDEMLQNLNTLYQLEPRHDAPEAKEN